MRKGQYTHRVWEKDCAWRVQFERITSNRAHGRVRQKIQQEFNIPGHESCNRHSKRLSVFVSVSDAIDEMNNLLQQIEVRFQEKDDTITELIDEVAITSMMLQDHTMELMRRSYTKNDDKAFFA
jgi:hypothetical protein